MQKDTHISENLQSRDSLSFSLKRPTIICLHNHMQGKLGYPNIPRAGGYTVQMNTSTK